MHVLGDYAAVYQQEGFSLTLPRSMFCVGCGERFNAHALSFVHYDRRGDVIFVYCDECGDRHASAS